MANASLILRGMKALLDLLVDRLPVDKVRKAYSEAVSKHGVTWGVDSPLPDPIEYGEAVDVLRILSGNSSSRTLALATFLAYRHSLAHERSRSPMPTIEGLSDAVTIMKRWLFSLSPQKDITSKLNTEKLMVEMLDSWLFRESEVFGRDDLHRAERTPPTPIPTEIVAEYRGVLREMRETDWRKALKSRKIIILDGKHANRRATFLYWSGNVAYVRFKGEENKVGVPVDREVIVIKK